jgi:hypothetical protein
MTTSIDKLRPIANTLFFMLVMLYFIAQISANFPSPSLQSYSNGFRALAGPLNLFHTNWHMFADHDPNAQEQRLTYVLSDGTEEHVQVKGRTTFYRRSPWNELVQWLISSPPQGYNQLVYEGFVGQECATTRQGKEVKEVRFELAFIPIQDIIASGGDASLPAFFSTTSSRICQ